MAAIARLDSGLLQDFFGHGAPWPMTPGAGGGLRSLLVDVCEKKNAYEMTVDVPGAPRTAPPPACAATDARARPCVGIPKENIELGVEGHTIKISTRSTKEEEEKESGTGPQDTQWHRVERSTQFASRALRFPENADMSQARAVLHACMRWRACDASRARGFEARHRVLRARARGGAGAGASGERRAEGVHQQDEGGRAQAPGGEGDVKRGGASSNRITPPPTQLQARAHAHTRTSATGCCV
jgi:HSP20 family molecular chaperone IbpA